MSKYTRPKEGSKDNLDKKKTGCFMFGIRLEGCGGCRTNEKEAWRPEQLLLEDDTNFQILQLSSPLEKAAQEQSKEKELKSPRIEPINENSSSSNIEENEAPVLAEASEEVAQPVARRRIMSSPKREMQHFNNQEEVAPPPRVNGEEKSGHPLISSYDGNTWHLHHYPLPPGILTQQQYMNNNMLKPCISEEAAKDTGVSGDENTKSSLDEAEEMKRDTGHGLQHSWSGVVWDSVHSDPLTSSLTTESAESHTSSGDEDDVVTISKDESSGDSSTISSRRMKRRGVLKRRPNDNDPLHHRSYEEQAKHVAVSGQQHIVTEDKTEDTTCSLLPKAIIGRKLRSSVSASSFASVDSDGTDFDECEASLRRAESQRRVIFCLDKNIEHEITALCDMPWRVLRDCYWQPEEYAVMSQSRIWLERAVMRTGGRVRIRGESRRGLGLVCEPETRIARATKIQRTQRAVLRLHAEGASALKLAKFAQDASSWATRNALISAQKDLAAAHEPDTSPPRPVQRNLSAATPATNTIYHRHPVAPREQNIFTTNNYNAAAAAAQHSALRNTMRVSSTGDLITHATSMTPQRIKGPPYLPGSSVEAPAGPMPRCNSTSSDTNGLAALIRSDSLKNIHGTAADTLAAYAAARARRRQHTDRIAHAQAHTLTIASNSERSFLPQNQIRNTSPISATVSAA